MSLLEWAVVCPFCGAKEGTACVNELHREYATVVHRDRKIRFDRDFAKGRRA